MELAPVRKAAHIRWRQEKGEAQCEPRSSHWARSFGCLEVDTADDLHHAAARIIRRRKVLISLA